MRHHLAHRLVRLSVAAVAAAAIAGSGATASAGGWAMATVDEVPAATSGESEQIGFTILQHGETPVDLPEEVGIELVHEDGTVEFFPAIGDGTIGHYVTTVTFPESAGSYQWSIVMGRFGPQSLGTLDVTEAAGGTSGAFWPAARWVMLTIAVGLAAVAIADVAVVRRRRAATLT